MSTTSAGGPLIASFRVTKTLSNPRQNSELGAARGRWSLTPFGEANGFAIAGARLTAPWRRPPRWIGIDVWGGDFANALVPWFGEIHHPNGVGGCVVPLSGAERLLLRMHGAESPREIRIHGHGTAVALDSTVHLRAVRA